MFTRSSALRSLFAVAALVAAAVVQGQTITVFGADGSNDAIGPLDFSAHTFTPENTDGGSLHSIRSLAFDPNLAHGQLDLLAADNGGGLIVRYFATFNPSASPPANSAGIVVWNSATSCATPPCGPVHPDAMSVDSPGTTVVPNLYVVNSGTGGNATPQFWVLRPTLPENGTFATAQLIDSNYGAKEGLEDTLIVGTTIPLPPNAVCAPAGSMPPCLTQLNPGDALVLTNNPSQVLVYPGDGTGAGPVQMPPPPPYTLINLSPAGTSPGGMALTSDNNLLVTTSTGTIQTYALGASATLPNETPGIFVNGLGNGQFKIRVGDQGGNEFAFVADNNGGRYLEFNALGVLKSTVTTGVQHPQGLAVTNIAYQLFSTCFQNPLQNPPPPPCNLLGNDAAGNPLLTQQTTAQVPGNILGNVCVVKRDPRVVKYGSCAAAASALNSPYANGLSVREVCGAAFDNPLNPLFISNAHCGASNGSGFTVISFLTKAYTPDAGFPYFGKKAPIYVMSDSQSSGLPHGQTDPFCSTPPFQVAWWAPLEGEGYSPGGHQGVDTADGCATPHSGTGINSLEILGLSIDQNFESIVNYTNDQFTTLLNAVTAEVNDGVLTPPSPSPAPFGNFTQLLVQCISTARDASLSGSYLGSAQAAAVAAYDVFSKATDTSTFIAADANFPNPPGLVRSLIAAPEFSTRVRLGGGDATPPPYVLTQPSATNPVDIRPTVTGSPTTHATVGQQYSYAPGTATFFGKTKTLTYSLTVTGPSQWLTLSAPDQNNQVQVIGTPTVPGQYTVTFTETDGCEMNQTTASSSWKIKVTGKP